MLLNVGVDMRSYCLLLWSGHRVSLLVLLRARLKLLLMWVIFHAVVVGRLLWVTLALLLQVWGRSLLSLLVLFLRIWFWGHVKHLCIADWVSWRFVFLLANLLLLVLLLMAIFLYIDQRVFPRLGRDTVEPIAQALFAADERTLLVSIYLVFGRFLNKFFCCSHIFSIFK